MKARDQATEAVRRRAREVGPGRARWDTLAQEAFQFVRQGKQ